MNETELLRDLEFSVRRYFQHAVDLSGQDELWYDRILEGLNRLTTFRLEKRYGSSSR